MTCSWQNLGVLAVEARINIWYASVQFSHKQLNFFSPNFIYKRLIFALQQHILLVLDKRFNFLVMRDKNRRKTVNSTFSSITRTNDLGTNFIVVSLLEWFKKKKKIKNNGVGIQWIVFDFLICNSKWKLDIHASNAWMLPGQSAANTLITPRPLLPAYTHIAATH